VSEKVMKNAVVGVVHPFALDYVDEYLESMCNQSFQDFTLFIFGHRIDYQKLEHLLDKYDSGLDIIYNELNDNLSISKSRQKVLNIVKEKDFDTCIFTDTDDFYHKEFVKNLVEHMSKKKNKIVFSDLFVYFSEKNQLSNYFEKYHIPAEIDEKFLLDKNCIGLGHTGIRMEIYNKDMIAFPDKITAVDWWLFTVLMHINKCKASFIKKSLAYYRQHTLNTAGFLNLNEDKILHAVKAKRLHYKSLIGFGDIYQKEYFYFERLSEKISADDKFRKKYIEFIHSKYKEKKYLWWEYAEHID
jgi:hypothetical protein